MSRPTEDNIRELFAALRRLDIESLEDQLVAAMRRDATPGPAADGYSQSTGNDTGRTGNAILTSVEASADQRAFGTIERDQLRDHVENAWGFLLDGVNALRALDGRMELISKLAIVAPTHETAGTGHCQACGEYCTGTGNDRLRSGYCNACRMAWQRAGYPDRFKFELGRRPPKGRQTG